MSWWGRLLRRRQMEAQLDKELRFHLDEYTNDLIGRGYAPEEASRQARLALGGSEQVKEQCRDARGTLWVEELIQDVRYSLRTLRQKPGFAAVALCTLALGIGATTVVFTVMNGVLLKPLPYPEPGRLVAIQQRTEKYGEQWGISNPDFLDCRRESRTLALGAWGYGGGTVTEPGPAEYVEGRPISAELFGIFGVKLAVGRAFLPSEDRPGAAPVAIISEALWRQRYGGQAAAIGRPLVFDGKAYTVVGVAPAGFELDGAADVFTPLGQVTEMRMQNRDATFLRMVGRLRPGITPAQAQAELAIIGDHLASEYPRSNAGRSFRGAPLERYLAGNVRPALWLLLGAVSVVLLIACVNVASILLARAVSREREFAMRVALGAARSRLVRQCFTESAVLGILGGALGVLLAASGIRPFIVFWPGTLPRAGDIHLDGRVLLFALIASLGSGLLFGIAPALRVPAGELDRALRAGARTVAGGSRRLHSSFVTFEIALAVVLLAAAGTLSRAILRLSRLDTGINVHNVLTTRVALSPGILENSAHMRAAWREITDTARRVPGVQAAALSDIVPMRGGVNPLGYWTTPTPPPSSQIPVALASTVSPDYLKVMGLPLREGRFFDDHDRLDTEPVVVIDEVLAHHAFPHEDAVGKRLWVRALGPAPVRVVGVVGHVRHWGLADDDRAQLRDQMYYPFAAVPDSLMHLFSGFMSMTVRTRVPPLTVVGSLRHDLRGATGDQVLYGVRTMEQLASDSLARQRYLAVLFGIFAGTALVLACIGIYGVLAYLANQRVPEIGVRMALGATAGDVVRLVLRETFGMVLVGAAAGIAGGLAAAGLLRRAVTGVGPLEPLTIAVVVTVLATAAAAATFLPARRASRTDPVRALREE